MNSKIRTIWRTDIKNGWLELNIEGVLMEYGVLNQNNNIYSKKDAMKEYDDLYIMYGGEG